MQHHATYHMELPFLEGIQVNYCPKYIRLTTQIFLAEHGLATIKSPVQGNPYFIKSSTLRNSLLVFAHSFL